MFDPNLMQIGSQLVKNCREGREMQGLDELYAENAVSLEAASQPGGQDREFKGRDAIKAKHDWWNNAMEMHEASVEGPFFHGENQFGVIFGMDVTEKDSGKRFQMKELGIYTVSDGKIVREEFYNPPMDG